MEAREFVLGQRQQQEWQELVIIALFLTGTGSGLFLLSLITGFVPGMALGVVLVMAGALFLFLDLSRRLPAWRLISRPQCSWVSRGVIGITSFAVLGFFHTVFLALQTGGWSSLGAPWAAGPAWLAVLGVLAGVAAFFVAIYPGFLLGNMRSISFWNSAYIPALFLTSSLIGGFGVLYLLPFDWQGLPFLKSFGAGVVIFELILLLGLIWLSHPVNTSESVQLLTKGSLRYHFLIGLIGLGIIVPLVLLGLLSLGMGMAYLMLIEGILHLSGVFFLRYIIVRAAVHAPPC